MEEHTQVKRKKARPDLENLRKGSWTAAPAFFGSPIVFFRTSSLCVLIILIPKGRATVPFIYEADLEGVCLFKTNLKSSASQTKAGPRARMFQRTFFRRNTSHVIGGSTWLDLRMHAIRVWIQALIGKQDIGCHCRVPLFNREVAHLYILFLSQCLHVRTNVRWAAEPRSCRKRFLNTSNRSRGPTTESASARPSRGLPRWCLARKTELKESF